LLSQVRGELRVALSFQDKQAIVAEVEQIAEGAISLVVADYRGLSVGQMTQLRQQAREAQVSLQVVRNTLAKRAFKGTNFECVEDILEGPSIFGFAKNEPSAVARLFRDFIKKNKKFEVKALAVGDQYYDASHLESIASLPTRDEAFSLLAGTLMAPMTKLARTLAEPHTSLARALNAVHESRANQTANAE
jgi:large subunit ribosomal protein L10